ncbi:MAG: lasso peptide biosynthesis B2 protein [Desulfobulbaceae bacterium]|nr:lasso peptide biosynthesis B2 protein [Desulfobulbaceae bacterium]
MGAFFPNIKKFLKLSRPEQRILIEAYLTLGVMRAAILTIPFKKLSRSLRQLSPPALAAPLAPEERAIACAVGRGIKRAAQHTPWESACLAQSLTARRMLQQRGIGGLLYLGVKKKEAEDKGAMAMEAHAWSQCGEIIITGGEGSEAFTVISIFSWGN